MTLCIFACGFASQADDCFLTCSLVNNYARKYSRRFRSNLHRIILALLEVLMMMILMIFEVPTVTLMVSSLPASRVSCSIHDLSIWPRQSLLLVAFVDRTHCLDRGPSTPASFYTQRVGLCRVSQCFLPSQLCAYSYPPLLSVCRTSRTRCSAGVSRTRSMTSTGICHQSYR
jgi:hypothetical protein